MRVAIRAFNQMQERLRRFVDDRTQMVAAMSHDLKTPLTRLRLRAEFIEDHEQQRKMLNDLDEMLAMIEASKPGANRDAAVLVLFSGPEQSPLASTVEGLPDDADNVNPNGGAIALGHPLGASGGRLMITALNQLEASGGKRALCTMCIGVGQGIALALERV